MYRRVLPAAGLIAAVALAVTGCSSSGGSAGGSGSSSTSSMPSSAGGASASSPMTAGEPFGSACSSVPKTGAGSFNGMATDPVATAASHNPVLSTLVTAVTKAGLVSTLNSQQAITVFAPDNAAFAKIPSATLDKVLADKATLTKILTYHVLAGKIAPTALAGSHKTLEGQTVKVTGSGSSLQVGPTGTQASVVCGNVQTANATVYIIDSVMMPPASS